MKKIMMISVCTLALASTCVFGVKATDIYELDQSTLVSKLFSGTQEEQEEARRQIPPESIKAYLPGGTHIATFYADGFEQNMNFFDPLGSWRADQDFQEKTRQFEISNESLLHRLDELTDSIGVTGPSRSLVYTQIAVAKSTLEANLDVALFFLKRDNDTRVLVEAFKAIPVESRKKRFDTLVNFEVPEPVRGVEMPGNYHTLLATRDTVQNLQEELMALPFDSNKINLEPILEAFYVGD